MALVKVSALGIYVKQGTGSTLAGFNAQVKLSDDEAQVLIDPIKQMATIVETTGVGESRRQRRDAGLADLGGINVSGLLDPTDADGLYELLKSAHDAGASFELEVAYVDHATPAQRKSIKADWLVETLEIDHTVGTFVMVKGAVVANGKGYANTLT